jgi:hypothetical protein
MHLELRLGGTAEGQPLRSAASLASKRARTLCLIQSLTAHSSSTLATTMRPGLDLSFVKCHVVIEFLSLLEKVDRL